MIRHHRSVPPAERTLGQRGAVLVELGFVAILLATLVAGAVDFGLGWRTTFAVTEGARTGARVGSAQGNIVGADFALLSGMRSALSSSGLLADVNRVVIYRSDSATGGIPSSCRTTTAATISDPCNILTGDQFRALPATNTTGTTSATGCITNSQTKSWCPTTRNNVQITAEYIGIWVQVTYKYKFKLVGSTQTIERTAVMRLEPTEG